jgi:ParB-like chromosome segregation protein Spo0J
MANVQIDELVLDWSLYPRNGVNELNVARLVNAILTKVKLPPMVVEKSTKRIIDGFHRYHAYMKAEVSKVEVTYKVYNSEADVFTDAIRLNIGHGIPLDSYTIKRAILRFQTYGYSREQISEIVHLPPARIEDIERGFASSSDSGEPIALKGGLSHLSGKALSTEQQEVNRHYSGKQATYYLRQLSTLIENDMWPRSEIFAFEMNRLIELWTKSQQPQPATSQPA